MSQCLELQLSLARSESTMSFTTSTTAALQAITVTRELSMKDFSSQESDVVMNDVSQSRSQAFSQSQSQEDHEMGEEMESLAREVKNEIEPVEETWKQFSKRIPFLAVPPEIHLKILSFLDPIDATCLSLVNEYIHNLSPRPARPHRLDIGSPSSSFPIPKIEGCKHCVPVLYYPAHCELHYHLRSFIPRHLNYCSGRCGKFTMCEQEGYSDSKEICGECGISYRRRYERGRRMLDMLRPGEKQVRLNKWYNSANQS